jgi:predicted RND superfamily exporter protein
VKAFFARWFFGRPSGARVVQLSWPLALVIVIVAHAISFIELDRLTFNNSAEAYYPTDAPAVLLRNQLRQDFPTDEVLMVLFKGDQLFGSDFLGRLDKATAVLKSRSVRSGHRGHRVVH